MSRVLTVCGKGVNVDEARVTIEHDVICVVAYDECVVDPRIAGRCNYNKLRTLRVHQTYCATTGSASPSATKYSMSSSSNTDKNMDYSAY